ncbi:MAG: AI-2E family transporter [Flavobacteriia bacterium]|nr:MAG: AI-2E family transporter [Flavobacteriia bacterium]
MSQQSFDSKTISRGILRAVATLFIIALAGYILFQLSSVIIYIFISLVIALIFRPLILFMTKKMKVSKTIAVVTSIFILFLIISGFISLFIPLIIKESENLSLLNSEEFRQRYDYMITQVNNFLLTYDINIIERLQEFNFGDYLKVIPNFMNSLIGAFGNLIIGFLSVLFISFFFMSDSKLFNNTFKALIPDDIEPKVLRSTEKIKNLLSRYFLGLIAQISILFIIYLVVLSIVGIENAFVIAVIAALFNLIPYVGPLIGGIFIIIFTLTNDVSLNFTTQILPKAIWVLVGYIGAQLIDNFFSQPYIFSKSTKSHPLEIFLVILASGYLFGILGMVLAVPTYTALKVILKEFLSENEFVKHLTKGM